VPGQALAAAAAQPTPQAQAAAAERIDQQQRQQQQQQAAQRPSGQGAGMNLGPLSFGTGGIGINRGSSGGQGTQITFGTAPAAGQPIGMGNMFGFGRR
jgi:hypothetical protein